LSADRTSEDVTTRVEIDLFSGRPNPSFELDQSATHELLGLLGNMKRSQVKVPPGDGLGFRGFAVSVKGQPQVYVSGSVVSAGPQQFVDSSRMIERFLLSKMPEDQRRQFQDVLPKSK
jgi:hypothetical protein